MKSAGLFGRRAQARRVLFFAVAIVSFALAPAAVQAQLVAAVLPTSRSVAVGATATAFATMINAGTSSASNCAIAPATVIPATFLYQTTNPSTNALSGTANTPVTIPAGGFQTFVIALTPTAAFDSTDVALKFTCDGLDPAPSLSGVNTLLLTASATAAPDIVALGATASGDGSLALPSANGAAAFAVATVNVGATGTITVSADTGPVTLPVTLTICQTNPSTGACLSPPAATVTVSIAANTTPTFAIFVVGTGNIASLPGANRIYVRFKANGVTVGSTSVAVKTTGFTPPPVPAFVFNVPSPAPPNGTAKTAYPTYCFCQPAPSGTNGLCGFPTQTNPSGGNPPYHFSTSGFPPIGITLSLNGCLSGTPKSGGTSNFSVCAIDLNGTQKCRPVTIVIAGPASVTYSGHFHGTANFSQPEPNFNTTCAFHVVFDGDATVELTTQNNTTTGTVDIVGTYTSTATGGSTSAFTCLDSEEFLDASGAANVSGSQISWSLPSADGVISQGFTGTIGPTSIVGTVTETAPDCCSGSGSFPLTMAKQQ